MSAFNAGSIVGNLGLDVSEYAESMRESTSIAGTFAAEIGHILAEATGSPLLGELANGISEIVAAASEGRGFEAFAAGIHTAGEVAVGLIETIKEQAEQMELAGLAAEKYGGSVEFFSGVGKAAKASGLDIDGLGMSMKFLEDRAANAIDGQKEAIKAFSEVGITVQQLQAMASDPEQLFYSVADGLHQVEEGQRRVQASTDLMGRAGAMALPFFSRGSVEIKKFAQSLKEMGGTYSEEDAEIGHKFTELGVQFSAVIEGMKKEVAEPILKEIVGHSAELITDMKAVANVMAAILPPAIKATTEEVKQLAEDLGFMKQVVDSINSATGQHQDLSTSAGDYMSDSYKQALREKAGLFLGDIMIGLSSNENIGAGRLAHDFLWDMNHGGNAASDYDDGTYPTNGLPRGGIHLPPSRPTIVVNNNITANANAVAAAAADATKKAVVKGIRQHAEKHVQLTNVKSQMGGR